MFGVQATDPAETVLAHIAGHLWAAFILFNERMALRAIAQLDGSQFLAPFFQLGFDLALRRLSVVLLPAVVANLRIALVACDQSPRGSALKPFALLV